MKKKKLQKILIVIINQTFANHATKLLVSVSIIPTGSCLNTHACSPTSTRNHMQLGTEPLYLHLFVYFPFHRVSWFSASFIFRRSALFFHLCHVLSLILLSIFAVRKGRRGGGGDGGGEVRGRSSCLQSPDGGGLAAFQRPV